MAGAVDCRRSTRPGASGFAGGAGGGLGVIAAFCDSDFGSEGAIAATAATPAAVIPGLGGAVGELGAGAPPPRGAVAATAGLTVCECPRGLVMVTVFVVLLMTTVLWMLL